jgi:hypothetical protein
MLDKLMAGLKDGKSELAKKLAKLAKEGLIDLEQLELCEKAGECDTEGLADFLKESGVSDELLDAFAELDMPGRGGVTRGPGAASMLWKDPSTEEGVKFKEEVLPPSSLESLKDSVRAGLSAGAPQKGKGSKDTASSGALDGAASGGGSASTQVVLPRHRQAVERYFDREVKPAK